MKDLQRERGLTYLFISHNLAVVRHVSDAGRRDVPRPARRAGRQGDAVRAPRHPYTRMLLDAIPDIHMSGRARTPVQGEVPNPLQSAGGLRVPSALPACQRALPRASGRRCSTIERRPGRLPRGRGRPDLSGAQRAAGAAISEVLAAHTASASCLALADQPGLAAADHHLGGARPGVVVAGHAHRVGAGRQHGERSRPAATASARSRPSQSPDSQTGPTTSHVAASRRAALALDDPHPGVVHRRPHQVVHRRVDDAEVLAPRRGLRYSTSRQQHAGVADQRAAGLEQDLALAVAARIDAREQARDQLVGGGRRLVGVGDAQAAAEVDVRRAAMPSRLDRLDQIEQAVERVEVGRALGDLRADVAIDADHLDARQAARRGGRRPAPRSWAMPNLLPCRPVEM